MEMCAIDLPKMTALLITVYYIKITLSRYPINNIQNKNTHNI